MLWYLDMFTGRILRLAMLVESGVIVVFHTKAFCSRPEGRSSACTRIIQVAFRDCVRTPGIPLERRLSRVIHYLARRNGRCPGHECKGGIATRMVP